MAYALILCINRIVYSDLRINTTWSGTRQVLSLLLFLVFFEDYWIHCINKISIILSHAR